ncbi:MAG TPA: TIGR00299 family protein, partial [Elusimicrobia bacterium]|nr:TIGR00299 family protein [Elusimicrobiota bacterium]
HPITQSPSYPLTSSYLQDEVLLLETNIDDMNPQIYPYVMEKLFKKGALDVWLTPVQMKKGRPGIVLSCLVKSEKKEEIIDLLFRETTTLGIRILPWRRVKLNRKIKKNISGLVYKVAQGKNFKKEKVEYTPAVKIAQKSAFPLKNIL